MADENETFDALSIPAQLIVKQMHAIEEAEAKYAELWRTRRAPRKTFFGKTVMARWEDEGYDEPAFREIAETTFQLQFASDMLRSLATDDGMTWHEGLMQVLPQLFSDDSERDDGLREDNTFVYVTALTDETIMNTLMWRLEAGYC